MRATCEIAIANELPQLTVVINGLANLFSTSLGELAAAGGRLQQYAQHYGLVISVRLAELRQDPQLLAAQLNAAALRLSAEHDKRHDPRQHE